MNRNRRLLFKDLIKTLFLILWGMMLIHLVCYDVTADELISGMLINTDMYIAQTQKQKAAISLQDFLFPGAAYVYQEAIAQSYHPTEKEMEAMAEENSQYEELERIANERLAQSEGENNTAQGENYNVNGQDSENAMTAGGNTNSDASPSPSDGEDAAVAANINVNPAGTVYDRASLLNFRFLMNQFYVVDSSTACDESVFLPQTLLDKDLTMDVTGDEPKILIYHTHSQESFADSTPGDVYGTVIGLGNTLADILQNQYGVAVYHDVGTYDVINGQIDRSEAYAMALPVVEEILAAYPSIKVVIDLHRDGVNENTHLVTTINGKPTAKIMFFNGLCRNAAGTDGYMQNPYLEDNLAFSLKMQLKAAEKYPDFTRRIYLRSYRFNMHVAPRTLLVECGAQTNTVEEVQNAMAPLADILYCVLTGT